jgi:ParB-like chromosome segregation protein Spo0J
MNIPPNKNPQPVSAAETRHQITYLAIDQFKPNLDNARTHSPAQIRKLARSIRAHGFITPVVVDPNNMVIAGHGRLEAARHLGLAEIPTMCVSHLSPEQLRAFALADNRLHDESGWNDRLLAIELRSLSNLGLDFDIESTGFELAEIDVRIEGLEIKSEETDVADRLPDDVPTEPINRLGDLWLLGKHRLLCGNALETDGLKRLMSGELAAATITDPPFNVRVDGFVSGLGQETHREFAMASGEMTSKEFEEFLTTTSRQIASHSKGGALVYMFMDWRHLPEALAACSSTFSEFKNLCVWAKHVAGMGSFYRSQHELVLVFKNGRGRHRNNIELGRHGRNRSNIWSYPAANRFGRNAGEDFHLLKLHPTVKPVAMLADAMMDCTARGDLILDPFLGSGSTLIAAEKIGRKCYGIEIDPVFADLIVGRWESFTGAKAVHEESGKSFDDLIHDRKVSHG